MQWATMQLYNGPVDILLHNVLGRSAMVDMQLYNGPVDILRRDAMGTQLTKGRPTPQSCPTPRLCPWVLTGPFSVASLSCDVSHPSSDWRYEGTNSRPAPRSSPMPHH